MSEKCLFQINGTYRRCGRPAAYTEGIGVMCADHSELLQRRQASADRDALLERIVQQAAAVVEDNDLVDEHGRSMAPVGVRDLADALDALPLAERLRYGL